MIAAVACEPQKEDGGKTPNHEQPGGGTQDSEEIIEFEDPYAKSICIVFWDKNGDQELSYKEAESVTELNDEFRETNIRKFTELKYFTNLIKINNNAFRECNLLTSVTIPDSVTSIGDNAFSDCTSLTSITIPDSVITIGNYAFSYCDSLTSVTIPDSVTTIGYCAFSGCDSLTSVTIGNSVTTIGYCAFSGCDSLTSVTIPDSVITIGNGAFEDCTSLTSITIPDSVTTIGDGIFSDCTSLTSVTIGNSVTTIGSNAFGRCLLKEVYCKPTTPPSMDDDSFCIYEEPFNIYVPRDSVSAYMADPEWSIYESYIIGYDF